MQLLSVVLFSDFSLLLRGQWRGRRLVNSNKIQDLVSNVFQDRYMMKRNAWLGRRISKRVKKVHVPSFR